MKCGLVFFGHALSLDLSHQHVLQLDPIKMLHFCWLCVGTNLRCVVQSVIVGISQYILKPVANGTDEVLVDF